MITVNMNKAKAIGHTMRRAAREEEFAPYDKIISAQIPGQATAAEEARVAIRAKYAAIQTAIDSASTTEEIKAALETN